VLSRGVVLVISRLAILIEQQLVTDGQIDNGHGIHRVNTRRDVTRFAVVELTYRIDYLAVDGNLTSTHA